MTCSTGKTAVSYMLIPAVWSGNLQNSGGYKTPYKMVILGEGLIRGLSDIDIKCLGGLLRTATKSSHTLTLLYEINACID